jgi:hypothetical protein
MPIDNYAEAQALSDRLEATVPFQVRATKELLKTMHSKGQQVNADTIFTVDWVKYSGDIGGINCSLVPFVGDPQTGEHYVVSLTHLRIDPEHPLAELVQAYQHKRIQGLKLKDQIGFAAELMPQQPTTKRKISKGFGK